SNTVVAAAFFPVAYAAANAAGIDPLALMIAVSTASTCAFMTPVATPCNALAFGEMRGVSLRRMLALGLVLNLACASLMTLWLSWVVPLVYG
ncbi:MAG: anion permease, partial [Desulfovibrionaceae bacterium]